MPEPKKSNSTTVPARSLRATFPPEALGVEVRLKVEGANPTGSFKDRGMTMAISKAVEEGAEAVICASTGNTSAAAAAYSTRAGLTCAVLIPEGKIAMGKLAQALIHGAKVVQIEGNFDEALEIVRQLGETGRVTVVNSINPYRIEGQKTAAFEICEQFTRATAAGGRHPSTSLGMGGVPLPPGPWSLPDAVFVSVGDGNIISGLHKGFRDLLDLVYHHKLTGVRHRQRKLLVTRHLFFLGQTESVTIPRSSLL